MNICSQHGVTFTQSIVGMSSPLFGCHRCRHFLYPTRTQCLSPLNSALLMTKLKLASQVQHRVTRMYMGFVLIFQLLENFLVNNKKTGENAVRDSWLKKITATCERCPLQPSTASYPLDVNGIAWTCNDISPPGGFNCQQQKLWGKCWSAFMVVNNYCAATCSRCRIENPVDAAVGSSFHPAVFCSDIPPPDYPCSQQKVWGKCGSSSFISNNYCAATCKRCNLEGKSLSNRKLLD